MPKSRRKKKSTKKRAHPYRKNEMMMEADDDAKEEAVPAWSANKAKFSKFNLSDPGWMAPSRGFLQQIHKREEKRVKKEVRLLKERSLHHSKKTQEGKAAKKSLRSEVKSLQTELIVGIKRQLLEFDQRTPEQEQMAIEYAQKRGKGGKSAEDGEEQQFARLSSLATSLKDALKEDIPSISFD